MTIGLSLWSAMTAFSGFARDATTLTVARIGVGVGEATASPSAYSLISDWFPARLRATALAIYSSGLYIGGGVSLLIGGLIVDQWNAAYPDGGPLGLAGWQRAACPPQYAGRDARGCRRAATGACECLQEKNLALLSFTLDALP